jgi:hypothetical protein
MNQIEQNLIDRLFAKSTFSSRKNFDRYFRWMPGLIEEKIMSVLPRIQDMELVHEALMFLIDQQSCFNMWKKFLSLTDERGSIEMFISMMQRNAKYVLQNFEDLFSQVVFEDAYMTEQCMDVLFNSISTLKNSGYIMPTSALLILKKTGNIDYMRRFLLSMSKKINRDDLRLTEISRHLLLTLPPVKLSNSLFWEKYHNFLITYFEANDDTEISLVTKLESFVEALMFIILVRKKNNGTAAVERTVEVKYWNLVTWIILAIAFCIEQYSKLTNIGNTDAVDAVVQHIRKLCLQIVVDDLDLHNLAPKLTQISLDYHANHFLERNAGLEIIKGSIRRGRVKARCSSTYYIWKQLLPSQVLDNITPTTTVLKLANVRIFICSIFALSEIPYYKHFRTTVSLPTKDTLVGCIEIGDDNEINQQKHLVVFTDKCTIELQDNNDNNDNNTKIEFTVHVPILNK